jgi:hypothetical protein
LFYIYTVKCGQTGMFFIFLHPILQCRVIYWAFCWRCSQYEVTKMSSFLKTKWSTIWTTKPARVHMLLWIFEACDNKSELHAEFPKNSASLWSIKALPLIKDIVM